MWSWLSCYLVGHDYSICCEHGAIYLRCATCGRRSQGWDLRHGTDESRDPAPHTHGLATVRQH